MHGSQEPARRKVGAMTPSDSSPMRPASRSLTRSMRHFATLRFRRPTSMPSFPTVLVCAPSTRLNATHWSGCSARNSRPSRLSRLHHASAQHALVLAQLPSLSPRKPSLNSASLHASTPPRRAPSLLPPLQQNPARCATSLSAHQASADKTALRLCPSTPERDEHHDEHHTEYSSRRCHRHGLGHSARTRC